LARECRDVKIDRFILVPALAEKPKTLYAARILKGQVKVPTPGASHSKVYEDLFTQSMTENALGDFLQAGCIEPAAVLRCFWVVPRIPSGA